MKEFGLKNNKDFTGSLEGTQKFKRFYRRLVYFVKIRKNSKKLKSNKNTKEFNGKYIKIQQGI